MANWSELLDQYNSRGVGAQPRWVEVRLTRTLANVSKLSNDRNVLFYFSSFFQKPNTESYIESADVNGVMNALHGMDYEKGLTVIMHTSGGNVAAVEQITEYIHNKFDYVEVIVPVMAMSGGAMFALSCDNIIISKTGQLGPTDPQIYTLRGFSSVKDIIDEFKEARKDIINNPATVGVWSPILQGYGPTLYQKATQVETHAKKLLGKWLKNKKYSDEICAKTLNLFHDDTNQHSQRIGFQEVKKAGLNVQLLEKNQARQDAVLTAYHLATIHSENSNMLKLIGSNRKQWWHKNQIPFKRS